MEVRCYVRVVILIIHQLIRVCGLWESILNPVFDCVEINLCKRRVWFGAACEMGRSRSVSPFVFVTETFTVPSVDCLGFCPASDILRLSFLRDCLLCFSFGFEEVSVVNESSVASSSTREISSLRDVSCGRVLVMEGSVGNDKLFRREGSLFDIVCVLLFEDVSAFPAKTKLLLLSLFLKMQLFWLFSSCRISAGSARHCSLCHCIVVF